MASNIKLNVKSRSRKYFPGKTYILFTTIWGALFW